jgi:hypothetical protein
MDKNEVLKQLKEKLEKHENLSNKELILKDIKAKKTNDVKK